MSISSNSIDHVTPFFVVDRPISLQLLSSCGILEQSFKLGLMGNANTSREFQEKFREFGKGCKNLVKMADSGVFTKIGSISRNYQELFATYAYMGTNYGIMIDVIKDKDKTLDSAEQAIAEYKKGDYEFKLVGVAQGITVDEYLQCYDALKKLGFEHIAIGGLLKRIKKSARYVKVRDEDFIDNVINVIRKAYPSDWLFLLGSYHPSRHLRFNKYNIYGADFKGWILNYKPPEELLNSLERRTTLLEKQFGSRKKLEKARAKLYLALKGPDEQLVKLRRNELLRIRFKTAKTVKHGYYLGLVREMSALTNMSRDQLRDRRFLQVKNYIHKNVYGKMKPKKLLIVSCSATKRKLPWQERAIEVYDGPMFRMLRKSEILNNGVDLRIISAKFGMISPKKPIFYYDMKITPERAEKLRQGIKRSMEEVLETEKYKEIFVCMGKDYSETVDGIEAVIPEGCHFVKDGGRIGIQLRKVKDWLNDGQLSI